MYATYGITSRMSSEVSAVQTPRAKTKSAWMVAAKRKLSINKAKPICSTMNQKILLVLRSNNSFGF